VTDLENAWPDAVFNIATGYHTKKQQANIAAMLELTGIPFYGVRFQRPHDRPFETHSQDEL